MAGTGGISFRRVNAGRVSKEIVTQIKDAIRSGDLSRGDRLPSERELTEMFGVSRVTVRDAIRILETSGLIDVRVGAGGGAFVTAPDSSDVAEGISNMLLMRSTTPEDVTETRLILEVGMLPLICERATEEDIAELESLCEKGEEHHRGEAYDVALSAEFHARLAEATHNRVIEMLTHSLHRPLEESLRVATRNAPQIGRQGVREHRALVEAIRERRPDRAQEVMRKHLARTAKRLRTRS